MTFTVAELLRRSSLSLPVQRGVATLSSRRRAAFSTAAAAAVEVSEKLWIFDTTLRDGEQSPGATLTADEKVEIGKQLARLGVDICEAGFPIASQGDFDAVKRVALAAGMLTDCRPNSQTMRIAGLARANKKDIARCHEAVHHAPLHRIHTFLASSDIHLEHKLNITRAQCLETASKMVRCPYLGCVGSSPGLSFSPQVAFAKTLVDDIEFSPEDAGRSDPDFLIELCSAVIEAGATTINLPDTVGYTLPAEYGSLFAYLIEKTPTGGNHVIWSTHCHNDLGLATANSLAAVQQGARQVEVTLNSLGERAGNTSLEEVVMALRTRPQHFPVTCEIDTKQIMRTSKMVASYTGYGLAVAEFLSSAPRTLGADVPSSDARCVQHLCAAEQGDRRCECICARVGHPPTWNAQARGHLRDHDARIGRYRGTGRSWFARPREALGQGGLPATLD